MRQDKLLRLVLVIFVLILPAIAGWSYKIAEGHSMSPLTTYFVGILVLVAIIVVGFCVWYGVICTLISIIIRIINTLIWVINFIDGETKIRYLKCPTPDPIKAFQEF